MNKKILATTIVSIICSLSLTASAYAAPAPTPTLAPISTSEWLKLNQGFIKLTPEQQAESDKKSKLADEYVLSKKASAVNANSTSDILPQSAGGSKINLVGHFRQLTNYTCGPASAKNLISGYTQYNGGNSPSEATLATALHTSTSGTDFNASYWVPTLNQYAPGNNYTCTSKGSNWTTSVTNKVIFTIDKAKNYDVILDLNHGKISDPVRPEYAGGIAHYICAYGYNDVSKLYSISDSYSAVPQTYTCKYQNAADSSQGIVW